MAALAHLEALLRARKLDVTLTTAHPLAGAARATASTGLEWLDRQMAGGWPRGETSEIVGPASSGRTAVLCATLAAATGRGEIVALVDALDRFDPQSGALAGIELSHVLWARGQNEEELRAARDECRVSTHALRATRDRRVAERESGEVWARALERAVKAFGLVLQSGGFGVVALDLADVPARAIARLPFTTWMRLQRVVEGSDTVAVMIAPEPVSRSARGLSLRLAVDARTTPVWQGQSDRARVLAGLSVAPQVAASQRMLPLATRHS